MATSGYYRFPTIHRDTIVFVSEDDLWSVPAGGGAATRLTSGQGSVRYPALSPDGKLLAFSSSEEGHTEAYLMPAHGGQPRRLTFFGGITLVCGWSPDGKILLASNAGQPFVKLFELYTLPPEGGDPLPLKLGPAFHLSISPRGGRVLGRNMLEPARWKRYRGGLAGDIWVDETGGGEFHRLIELKGNLSNPFWFGDRVFFNSDHEGVGNLYSCQPSGKDLKRHTHHEDFYIRQPRTDGNRIVYHAGGDLYLYDPRNDRGAKVEFEYHSPQTQRNRKFVDPARYLESYAPHPHGHSALITTRGKAFAMGNWEGPVTQYGRKESARYRLPAFLPDGAHAVVISDADGEEQLEVHDLTGAVEPRRLSGVDIGRAVALKVAPRGEQILLSNHRNELLWIDLKTQQSKILDRSAFFWIRGFDWSPDAKWAAYGLGLTQHTSEIRIINVESGETRTVTKPVLVDFDPVFDPDGKFLYFLSLREFNPVYDSLHFDLGFPRGAKPYLVTLRQELPSPFIPVPKPLEEKPADDKARSEPPKKEEVEVKIDFDGIADRILAFPVPDARYVQIEAAKNKVFTLALPVEGALGPEPQDEGAEAQPRAVLHCYDLENQKNEPFVDRINGFDLSADRTTLLYRQGNRLRAVVTAKKPDDGKKEGPGRKSGWIDLNRIKVEVDIPAEWLQMFREAWRLQRDNFWTEDMSEIDWTRVYDRYLPLLGRIASRGEFSDLMWEMQGELGTSHAYEMGGDYRREPQYPIGSLGADYLYDPAVKAWRFAHIVTGDPWNDKASSPLIKTGVGVKPGDTLLAVNGRRLERTVSPRACLVNQAGIEIALTVGDAEGGSPRVVTVRTLGDETSARYRDWVEANRRFVHEKTNGEVGYVHVPNMGPLGYAEFHRYFLSEIDRYGLIVDVRYNGGGHVSQLILEKLSRRRIAYNKSRWYGTTPYPRDSVAGPMVALTNEHAGSDGDIFSHCFKLLKLGPLVGTRTWGGVIGIWPRHTLLDGSVTTQPEFAFWFTDVGWQVENYGTDPDIETEIRPQDYHAGRDPQLERAIQEVRGLVSAKPRREPDFSARPSKRPPVLPKP